MTELRAIEATRLACELERLERKMDAALIVSIYALAVASHRPRRRTLTDRLWDMI